MDIWHIYTVNPAVQLILPSPVRIGNLSVHASIEKQ